MVTIWIVRRGARNSFHFRKQRYAVQCLGFRGYCPSYTHSRTFLGTMRLVHHSCTHTHHHTHAYTPRISENSLVDRARYGHTLAVLGADTLLLAGGEDQRRYPRAGEPMGDFCDDLWRFRVVASRWERLGVERSAAALVRRAFHTATGASGACPGIPAPISHTANGARQLRGTKMQ